jgi:hypothetical protein
MRGKGDYSVLPAELTGNEGNSVPLSDGPHLEGIAPMAAQGFNSRGNSLF